QGREQVPVVVVREDRRRVAADRHERAVADGDLSRVAEQDVQPEDRREVDADARAEAEVVAAHRDAEQDDDEYRDAGDAPSDEEALAHTLRTCFRPKRPVGRTSSTRSSTANAIGRRS